MGRILLSAPHASGHEEEYIHEAFASNWLSTVGPQLDAFESEMGRRLGTTALALSSGTAALHLGLRLLGVGPGDEVLCPTMTFVATVNPIVYLGARPVLVDSEPRSWNIDPQLLREALAARAHAGLLPRAVVVVHLYGQSADMDEILDACARYEVPVLEDAAEALGATYRGRPLGTLGDLGVFSFNGNKIITTTGGGMLVGRDREGMAKARFWATQARKPGLGYEHEELGYNYRMSNLLAAMGRAQLEVLDDRVRRRREIAARYREALADAPGLTFMPDCAYGLHTHWLSCLLVDPAPAGTDRDGLIAALDAADIETRPVWKPMHLQPLYRDAARYGGAVAEDLSARGLCLPSSSSLTEEDQARVIAAIRARLGQSEAA
jgi:pyridoxal phosphate-dependent aminotransferase EpsN